MAALRAGLPPPVCRWGRSPHHGGVARRLLERGDIHTVVFTGGRVRGS